MTDNQAKWERLVGLVASLLKCPEPMPLEQIRLRVEGYGPPVESETARKRLQRDVEELKQLGVEIGFVTASRTGQEGYEIDRAKTFLPNVHITERENVLLNLLSRCLVDDARSPLSEHLHTALLKLQCSTGPVGSAEADLEEKILIHKDLGARAAPVYLAQAFTAVSECRTVCFDYLPAGSVQPTRRTVDVYGVGFRAAAWYLVGRCHDRNGARVFRLSRIQGRMSLAKDSAYEVPDDFDIDNHVGIAPWKIGSEGLQAKIRFDSHIAWMIAQNAAGSDRFDLADDGSGVLTTQVRNPVSLIRWVLKFKSRARILEPVELVDRMIEELDRLGARYKGAGG